MNLTRASATTLLACVGLLVSDMVHAQARGPSRLAPRQVERSAPRPAEEAAARKSKLAEMEAWLGRMVGEYRLEGTVSAHVGSTSHGINLGQARCGTGQCFLESRPQGVGVCSSIGSGPGVLCRIDMPWPRFFWEQVMTMGPGSGELPFSGPNLQGAMTLYGIDPDNLGIRFLMVDGKSTAIEALGFLEGDRAVFRTGCMNLPSGVAPAGFRCEWVFQIRIREDGKTIEMLFETTGTVRLAAYDLSLRREVRSQEHEAPPVPGASALPGAERE